MASHTFVNAIVENVFSSLDKHYPHNIDYLRFPRRYNWRELLRERVFDAFNRAGLLILRELKPRLLASRLSDVLRYSTEYEDLYSLLADEDSRQLLVELLTLRVLGPRRVRLRKSPAYRESVNRLPGLQTRTKLGASNRKGGPPLSLYRLDEIGYPIQLFANSPTILNTYLLEQYNHRIGTAQLGVQPNDTVIDGGGCWGDTALYFAYKVGAAGHVFTCEFSPSNLAVLHNNIELNPTLSPRITVIPRALWSRSEKAITYTEDGPSTSVREGGTEYAEGLSIDDLVRAKRLSRVDFIKLDVEGAEAHALKGAEETIHKFRPTMAIAAYHKPNDFWEIPRLIRSLEPSYDIYLDHFTIHFEETVIFASARTRISTCNKLLTRFQDCPHRTTDPSVKRLPESALI